MKLIKASSTRLDAEFSVIDVPSHGPVNLIFVSYGMHGWFISLMPRRLLRMIILRELVHGGLSNRCLGVMKLT